MSEKTKSVLVYLATQYNAARDNNYELKAWYFNGERTLILAQSF